MRTATASLPSPAEAVVKNGVAFERGSRLGPYELLVPIASGGMGHVWAAVRIGDFGFRRLVAVKVMREELAEDPIFRTMFLDEARLASRILNSHVVEVLDLGEADGVIYQAMALVDGDSLARLVSLTRESGGGPIAPEIAARIVSETLRGLHAAHDLRDDHGNALEFVHRDVSPHNVLVGLDGVAKITDFGIAKAVNVAKLDSAASGAKGKIAYMAPEQLRGESVDRRCDLFAVGVVLWELLANERVSNPGVELLAGGALRHPSALRPDAHRGLGDVAMKALSLAREQRFATAEEMADAVERAAHDSGLVLSSKTVAAWVSGLARERILRRKHDAEEQLARSKVFREHVAIDGVAAMRPPDAPRVPRAWALAAALLTGTALLVGGIVWMKSLKREVDTAPRREPIAVTPEPAPLPPLLPNASASSLVDSTTNVPKSVHSAAAPTAPSPPSRRPVIKVHADVKPTDAPKPKYDDPYRR